MDADTASLHRHTLSLVENARARPARHEAGQSTSGQPSSWEGSFSRTVRVTHATDAWANQACQSQPNPAR